MQAELACLREQVAAARDIAEESSRAYQQLWEQQETIGRLAATAGTEDAEEELESIRRREMLYLGQAAALQWVLARVDQIIATTEPPESIGEVVEVVEVVEVAPESATRD